MAENLNYDTDSSWCYENNSSNCDTYGRLYEWNAVMHGESSSNSNPSGVQGICPDGWHVPSDEEWTELVNYLGNDGYSGSEGTALKSESGWYNNGNGTDNFGFTALPVGLRHLSGNFGHQGEEVYWWSSTEINSSIAWYMRLIFYESDVYQNLSDKEYGYSVRCVRDD
jgi:uncharacterized protein (TIGR02145 family)